MEKQVRGTEILDLTFFPSPLIGRACVFSLYKCGLAFADG